MYLFILSRDIYTGQPDTKILPAKMFFLCVCFGSVPSFISLFISLATCSLTKDRKVTR